MEVRNQYPYIYRCLVIDNKDPEKYGRVKIWVPDLMPNIPKNEGIWACSANNPIGGRNDQEIGDEHHYMGTSYIPKIGSWAFCFFELANPNRPFYFGALNIQNTQTLPENRVGENYEDKWVIFKSHDGRCIVISDDPDDSRVEITGKKRNLSEPPTGDEDSVYTIDGNQTSILLDEREGKEKLLIRTYKGDFIHIDIDEQKLQAYFTNEIDIKSDGDIKIFAGGNIDIKASSSLNSEAGTDVNIKAGSGIKIEGSNVDLKSGGALKIGSSSSLDVKSGAGLNLEANGNINIKANGNINSQALAIISNKAGASVMIDAGSTASMLAGALASIAGSAVAIMGGAPPGLPATSAGSASSSSSAEEAFPVGERDT